MGVIFSLMLMLPLAEKKLQTSISDDRNNTITEMNELSDILRLYNLVVLLQSSSNNENTLFQRYCNWILQQNCNKIVCNNA